VAITYGDRRADIEKERKGCGRLRIAASDIEPGVWSAQDPCELARSNMIETEGLV
jgi:hypothetical protein